MQRLTEREDEVMRFVCMGYGNKKIGLEMKRSQFTIKQWVARSLAKLGVSNRTAGAIVYVAKVNPSHLSKCGL